jgi:hypothetical protein
VGIFGSFPITCPDLATRIVNAVRDQHLDERLNEPWTRFIKATLCDLGHEYGFTVFFSGGDGPQRSEFLLDLVWYSDMGGIELAVESEWLGAREVLADFKKLLYVKAPVKVMIYWVESHAKSGERVRREIIRCMEQYSRHVAGEEYLFVALGKRADDRCYSYIVPKDGINQSISLSPLSVGKAAGTGLG